MRVCVFVLGEIGRSPRMQYHSLSLSHLKDCHVDLMGLSGSDPHPTLLENPNITLHPINEKLWTWMPRFHFLLYLFFLPLKVLIQFFTLFYYLMTISKPEFIFVQTPPAIPTLILVQMICLLRGSKLVIDWHNYGHTLLKISIGDNFITSIIKYLEMYTGRFAYHHFCVSQEMKKDLLTWGIDATVLYDRPPAIFKDLTLIEKHKILSKISTCVVDKNMEKTPFTIQQDEFDKMGNVTSNVFERDDRPGLIISSTSWTKDENFDILLDAIVILEEKVKNIEFPNLDFIITGKGDGKKEYEEKMKLLKLKKCRIQTKWLESSDYPKLLGSCDLGICLHTSSSQLDLPMKVVDMFGAGLPVLAIEYKTIHELVENHVNGIIFQDQHDLAQHLFDLFENFPTKKTVLNKMKKNLKEFQKYRWNDEWNEKALPLFQKI